MNLVELEIIRWNSLSPPAHEGLSSVNECEILPSSSFWIEGNPSHGEGLPIPIQIGEIQHFGRLNQKNLGTLFGIINQVTLTPYYPSGESRSNHDGTHSARQARMLEILLDKITKHQTLPIDEDERIHLTLAAYLLRSGRVDESCHLSHNPDDYYTRSALIYEAYAKQCVVDPAITEGLQKVIKDSCKPVGVRDPIIDESPKYIFWWNCLTIVHELDLIRCFSKQDIDDRIKGQVRSHLSDLGVENAIELTEVLFDLSKELCERTGCGRIYDWHPGDATKFAMYSADGKACWDQVNR